MSLCVSADIVPSSTFWLVAVFLSVAILIVFNIANKTKQESELFSVSINNNIKSLRDGSRTDINVLFARIAELEKKISECKPCDSKPSPEKKSRDKSSSDSDSDTE